MNATRIIRDPELNKPELTVVAGQEIRIPCDAVIDNHLKETAKITWVQVDYRYERS